MSETTSRKLTNADILLQDGLVEYFDPIDNVTKQVTVEMARRIAVGNTVMRDHLLELGVELEPAVEPEQPENEETV